MLPNTPPNVAVCGGRLRVALGIIVLAWFVGATANDAHAKCGSTLAGASWQYASTAELIDWNGRWWFVDAPASMIQDDSHFDADSKPCSRCGGRPVSNRPLPPSGIILRLPSQMVLDAEQPSVRDLTSPIHPDLIPADPFLLSRALEVAKRPPRASA